MSLFLLNECYSYPMKQTHDKLHIDRIDRIDRSSLFLPLFLPNETNDQLSSFRRRKTQT